MDYNVEVFYVGYRWHARTQQPPLSPFSHGLSFTTFSYGDLQVASDGKTLTASFRVTNTVNCAGADVPLLFVEPADHQYPCVTRPEAMLCANCVKCI